MTTPQLEHWDRSSVALGDARVLRKVARRAHVSNQFGWGLRLLVGECSGSLGSPLPLDCRRVVILTALVLACIPMPARAQTGPNAVVGLTAGRPLLVERLDAPTVAALALAAGVPMGFERAGTAHPRSLNIPATGKIVREVLDAAVAANPRYAWRDDDGVIVIYPKFGSPAESLLQSHVGSFTLPNVDALGAYDAVRRLFALPFIAGLGDTKRFSLDVAEGSTFRQLLNAIVRAHGMLAWIIEPTHPPQSESPFTFHLFSRPLGIGSPLPARGFFYRTSAAARMSAQNAATPVDVPLLDRVVGTDYFGQPLTLYGADFGWDVPRLGAAVRVPMGVQTILAGGVVPSPSAALNVTGLPLRAVLAALTTMDSRYEWREVGGVIVFRPRSAWTDADDPLFRLVGQVPLKDVPGEQAIGALLAQVGAPERAKVNQFSDSRLFSVDLPPGTVLDALNTIVRSHGEMSWSWRELSPAEQESWYPTRARRVLTFSLFRGAAEGYPLP